ncbi:MAG: 4-hydroxy-tetrahydrodipicolinate reductase [Firmicutes bacterium]|nr:4-hydroxy-tetrahydrodipicolinate reductase [Bacillota bacterium]
MINVLLIGANGKMGQECLIRSLGFDNINLMPSGKDTDFNSFNNVDVLLDYSHFSALDNILEFAIKKNIPLVIAATGHNNKQLEKIEQASKIIPIFKATNFSIAVNKFINTVVALAKNWDGDIEIIETHHNKKADAPSGTAITIAQSIIKARNKGNIILHRTHENAIRNKDDIYISAVRGGVVPGTHEVRFFCDTAEISIKEVEYGRSSFARGALETCIWMKDKKAQKIYNIIDLLEG